MKFLLGTEVQVEDASFWFIPCAGPEAELAAFAKAHGKDDGSLDYEGDMVPPELADVFERLFVKGCRRWLGVEGGDGKPIPCTEGNREAIPTAVKLEAVGAYLLALQAAGVTEGNAPSGDAPPTPLSAEADPAQAA